MRQKVFYLLFIFIMIFLLFLINKKVKVIQPILEEKKQQQISNTENASLLGGVRVSPLSSKKSNITPIRKKIVKSSSESLLSPSEAKNPDDKTSVQSVSSSSDVSASEPLKKANSVANEESSGITKISKRPTAEKKQQLKDKGILLF